MFKDNVVLVTGSSKGIGKATALSFAKEGAKVVVNYLKSKKEAEEVVTEIKKTTDAISIKCDVSDEKQVKKMIATIMQKFGKLDILVNNVGNYIDGDEWNGSSEVWERTLKEDLISAMNTSKYAAEIFLKQKNGVIINVASRYSISGHYDAFAYAASKAGLVSITQSYAKLLAPNGRANAVSPWPVRAGYWLRASPEEFETIKKQPAKRLLEPQEIANAILLVASSKSKLNGENVLVDGTKK